MERDLKRKIMDSIPMNITDPPEFIEAESGRFTVQTIRDPNTGKLCYSVSEFVDPETLKKLKDVNNEIN